jgi:hypothetical protein
MRDRLPPGRQDALELLFAFEQRQSGKFLTEQVKREVIDGRGALEDIRIAE